MQLSQILTAERIFVDRTGIVSDKAAVLRVLSEMLAPAVGEESEQIESRLAERERLQSTGIGDGVAIPHSSVEAAAGQSAALLLCPGGVDFDAIDGALVSIIFGVVGPKRSTGEHLRTLARISRLLRSPATRDALLHLQNADEVFAFIERHDQGLG